MLFKLTGSHSLQLCHRFGRCTAVLFSSAFQHHFMESSHMCPRHAGRKGAEANGFPGTGLPNGEASPPRGALSLPLPRPYDFAASSPTHTNILATMSQAPQSCLQPTVFQPCVNGTILPMPRQPEPSKFGISPGPGCWLIGLESWRWLGDPGPTTAVAQARDYCGTEGLALQEVPFPLATPPQHVDALVSCPRVITKLQVLALRVRLSATTTSPICCFGLPVNSCHTLPLQGQDLVSTHTESVHNGYKSETRSGNNPSTSPFPP